MIDLEGPGQGRRKRSASATSVGEDNFSLAFTYAMMAVNDRFWRSLPVSFLG
jgi:hypothetical protein